MTAPDTAAATTAAGVGGAAAAKAAQFAIRARAMQDAVKLWPLLDPKNLDGTFPGWVQAMRLLIRSYRGQSSAAAGAAYRQARQAATESPAPRSLIKAAPDLDPEVLRRALGYAGPGLLTHDTARPGTALSTTLGTTARLVGDAGRGTVQETVLLDPVAVGMYRVTDGNPCSFCALLASRGVVYKAHSFDASNAKFEGSGLAKVHNHCGCDLAPAFRTGPPLPAVNDEASQVYRDRNKILVSLGLDPRGHTAMQAFRIAWDARAR